MSNENPEEKSELATEGAAGDWPQRLEFLRGLAAVAQDEQLAELELEQGGMRITLRGQNTVEAENVSIFASGALPHSGNLSPSAVVPAPEIAASGSTQSTPPTAKVAEENLATVVSPMVGMFYRAPSPSDPNFVEVGDKVESGQTVALVEAMKVFNEITAETAGVIVEIKAESGDLVETGQVLLTIRP